MKFAILYLLLLIKTVIFAQNWQSKSEKLYRFLGKDSLLVHQKSKKVDAQNRIIDRKEYFYSTVPPENALYREENSSWESPILIERAVTYPAKKPVNTDKLELNYKKYHQKEDSCQVFWARKYDNKGEMNAEDTFTYNKKDLLIKKYSYNYQGSTSLVSEHYRYNKKGLVKRYRYYAHWTTVNMRGRAAKRKKMRIEYKYKYKKGLLVSCKGKNYTSYYKQIKKYDKQNLLTLSETTVTRTHKTSAADRAKNDSLPKKQISMDKKKLTYENGNLSSELIIESNVVRKKLLNTYKDNLLIFSQLFGKGEQKQEEKDFVYENKILKNRTTRRYNDKQLLAYTVEATHDERGNIKSEIQTVNNKIISTVLHQYDNNNNLIDLQLLNQNGEKIEHTIIEYKY